jgi:hypothetical protein
MSSECAPIIFPAMQNGDTSPVEEPGAFGPLTHREALPILGVKQERFHFPDFYSSALSITGKSANRFIARDGQYIRVLMGFQPVTQVQIAAIDRVCHHPSNRDLGLPQTRQHASGQFRFGLEANRLGDTSSLTPLTVLCPVQGQGEFAGNSRMPSGCDIGEKDTHLTILAAFQWFRNIAPRRLPSACPVWENSFRR